MQRKNNKEVTIVILTYNEEEVVANAVRTSLQLTQNIIVIDSFSTDRTVKIAKNLCARIVTHKIEDFSKQRNYALKNVTTKWVFYLDADEELSEGIINEINEITLSESVECAGYFVLRDTYFYGKRWGFFDKVQRLFLTSSLKEWKGVVHETPIIEGKFGELKNVIRHNTHRNLSQMLKKTNEWSIHEARLRFESGHPKMNAFRFLRVIVTGFYQSYFNNRGYKNGTYGVIEAMYQGYSMFITYAKLWEMQEQEKVNKPK